MILNEAASDWLGSKNFFYNIRTNEISDNINDIIDFNYIKFHPEGLNNYLEYGYSAYGQTPIEEIKVLRPNMHIYKDSDGKLVVEKLEDPFEKLLGNKANSDDTLAYLEYIINKYVKEKRTQIIVPTSGGFDSRLINTMIKDKKRIHSYTYGISENQKESYETVYASKLCEILGIKWEQIELGNFNSLINEWESIYGCSTHSHGMYQMEFYHKIRMSEPTGVVISGLWGDVWAGKVRIDAINSIDDLSKLSLSHSMNAEGALCKIKPDHELKKAYFSENKKKLQNENWRILEMCRTKSILLSYLLRIPEYYGFEAWSPFLDEVAVAKILNLDWSEKKGRKWQVDYFRKNEVLIGEMNLICDKRNCLNGQACRINHPQLLDSKLLSLLFDRNYIETINRKIERMSTRVLIYSDSPDIVWYCQYLVLHPLESILKRICE